MKRIKIIMIVALSIMFCGCNEDLKDVKRAVDPIYNSRTCTYSTYDREMYVGPNYFIFYTGYGIRPSREIALSKTTSFSSGSYKIVKPKSIGTNYYIDNLEPNTTYYYKYYIEDQTGYKMLSENYGEFTTLKRPEECFTYSLGLNLTWNGIQGTDATITINDDVWKRIVNSAQYDNKLRVRTVISFDNGKIIELSNTSYSIDNGYPFYYYYEDDADMYAKVSVYAELYIPNPLYNGQNGQDPWILLCKSGTITGYNDHYR